MTWISYSGEIRVAGIIGEWNLLEIDPGVEPPSYSITGVVTVAGTPTSGITIRLYDRATGDQLSSTTTDGSGVYTFASLNNASEKYFVLAFDPSGGTVYNLGRLDRLTAGN